MNRTQIKPLRMWAVFIKGQKKPAGICETRSSARKMQRAYENYVNRLGKRK